MKNFIRKAEKSKPLFSIHQGRAIRNNGKKFRRNAIKANTMLVRTTE